MLYNVILNDPDGLPCTIKSLLEGDCICYNAIMLPHTIENII